MNIVFDQLVLQHAADGPALLRIPQATIASGQRVLLRGASGAGKSSLLHVIAGLASPRSGDVVLDGVSLARASERERTRLRRERIGFVFQRLNLLDHLTAAENVQLGAPGRRLARGTVADALERVGLGALRDRPTWQLSLGEQQRVAVARVLATRPALLIADEPTSSLDASNAERVIATLVEAAADATLLVATHDPRIAHHFDRRWTVEDGTIAVEDLGTSGAGGDA